MALTDWQSKLSQTFEDTIARGPVLNALEARCAPDREQCEDAAHQIMNIPDRHSGHERALNEELAAALRIYAKKNARDSLVFELLPKLWGRIAAIVLDVSRTQQNVSNAVGTMILLAHPELEEDDWREECLDLLAGVAPGSPRQVRAKGLVKMLAARSAISRLSSSGVRALSPKFVFIAKPLQLVSQAAYGYGEVIYATRQCARAHAKSLRKQAAANEGAAPTVEMSATQRRVQTLLDACASVDPFSGNPITKGRFARSKKRASKGEARQGVQEGQRPSSTPDGAEALN